MKNTASSVGKILWSETLFATIVALFIQGNPMVSNYAMAVFVVFLAFKEKMPFFPSRETPSKKALMIMMMLVFAMIFLTSYLYDFFEILLKLVNLDQGSSILANALGTGWFMFFHAVILAPLIEELLFRGLLLRRLEPYGATFAVLATSMLFGLQHSFLTQAVGAFFAGCLLATVSLKYGLRWSILLHAFNNLLGVLLLNLMHWEQLTPALGSGNSVLPSQVANLLFAALSFLSLVYLLRLLIREKSQIRQWWQQNKPEKGLFRTFFTNPWVLTFVFLDISTFLLVLFGPTLRPGLFG